MILPCSVTDLIPQKGKMGFTQTLIKVQDDDCQSTFLVPQDNIFVDDQQRLSNIALVEVVNQLIAAIQGYKEKAANQGVRQGLFVGLQEVQFFQTVHSGDQLTVTRIIREELPPVNFAQGVIDRDGEKIAEFITKIYEVEDLSEFSLIGESGANLAPEEKLELNNQLPPAYLISRMQRNLYTYLNDLNIGEDSISFKIVCSKEFAGFDGHFPGNPILPGIILLEIATLGLELFQQQPIVLKYLKRMKISGVVLPNQIIACHIKISKNDGGQASFSAVFKEGETREVSRFNGCYEEGIL